MLLLYLTTRMSSTPPGDDAVHSGGGGNDDDEEEKDIALMLDRLLPFSFIPSADMDAALTRMDASVWPRLSHVLSDGNRGTSLEESLRDAVSEHMLVHKLHRILVEKPRKHRTQQEVHIALWLLLKCVLVVGPPAIDVILRVFDVEQLLHYVELKSVHRQRLVVFGSPEKGAYLEADKVFEWDTEIVWLAFALVSQLVMATAPPDEQLSNVDSLLQQSTHMQVLRERKTLVDELMMPCTTQRVAQVPWRLESSVGRQLLDNLFRVHMIHMLLCDRSPLVELALNTLAQIIACLPPRLWLPLGIEASLLRMMLSQQESILLLVARCLFMAILRSDNFTQHIIRLQVEDVSFVNELVELSLAQQEDMHSVQVQCMLPKGFTIAL